MNKRERAKRIAWFVKSGLERTTAESIVDADEKAEELLKAHPTLPSITARIIAGDLVSADRWAALVKSGERTAEQVVWLIGSYARFQWALDNLGEDWVHKHIAELWRGSDPDDTDQHLWGVWENAVDNTKDGRYIRDGHALPRGATITVFRGQMPGEPIGCAWTTDPEIAKKFARGAGTRVPIAGSVLMGVCDRGNVLAYLTKRGESEVVIRPSDVHHVTEVGYYGKPRDE